MSSSFNRPVNERFHLLPYALPDRKRLTTLGCDLIISAWRSRNRWLHFAIQQTAVLQRMKDRIKCSLFHKGSVTAIFLEQSGDLVSIHGLVALIHYGEQDQRRDTGIH